ncbi:YbdK family carboxylate-amine ligase [Arcanobacterium hippocoleae]
MLNFASSARSTLGIEWELQLIDQDSFDLRQTGDIVLAKLRESAAACDPKSAEFIANIHGEMLLNTVELVSHPHRTVKECVQDISAELKAVRQVVAPMRIELAGAGTHPFANPAYQRVTDKERYSKIVNRTQYWGRQMLLFGTHVHVGVEQRELVLPVINALLTRFAQLQALTAASPYWNGVNTGYADNRAMVFQQLPTAGVPHQFSRWEELTGYYTDMKKTGVIDGFSEIRWDIRPSPKFGTIELRMCDAASNIAELAMAAAVSQCLVEYFVRKAEAGRNFQQCSRGLLMKTSGVQLVTVQMPS